MTEVILPNKSRTSKDANLFSDVYENDVALKEVLEEKRPDADLLSPNNSVYRKVAESNAFTVKEMVAGTYFGLVNAGALVVSGYTGLVSNAAQPAGQFYVAAADYTVASKTTRLRTRVELMTNGTAPGCDWTVGLYPLTLSGGADQLIYTLGTVVTGSTAKITSPGTNKVNVATGSDFAVPTDGLYILGVVTSAKFAASAAAICKMDLALRHT